MSKINKKAVRKLLLNGLTPDDLNTLCQYDFEKVYEVFSPAMTITQRVDLLVSHCDKYGLMDKLLPLLREQNPVKYEEYAPYYEGEEPSSPGPVQPPAKPEVPAAAVVSGGGERKRILFLAANTKDATPLDLAEEQRLLVQEMRSGSRREDYEWQMPVWAADLPELMRALSQNPHLVHFSGHGGPGGLYLQDSQGYAQLISTEILQILFAQLKGKCECLLLNACYSATQAKTLSALGFWVIGYNLPIGDRAAMDFAKGFYLGLSEGKSYTEAAQMGKAFLMLYANKTEVLLEIWKDGELYKQ